MKRNKAVSALIWSGIGQLGATGISTIFVLIFARFVSPSEFGVFGIATVLTALSTQLSGLGLSTALIQREKLSAEVFSTAFWMSVGTAMVIGVMVAALAGPIARLFSAPQLTHIMPLTAIAIIINNAATLQSAILRRDMNLKSLAIRTFFANLTGGAIATPLAISGYGIYALVVQYLIAAILTLVWTILVTGWQAQAQFRWPVARELLSYGVPVMKADFIHLFNMESPKFFIGLFLGTTALGYYSMASRLLNMSLMIFATTLSNVAFPLLSETNRKSPGRMNAVHLRLLRLAALAFVPMFSLLAILSENILVHALGQHWAGAASAAAMMSLAGIPISLGYLNGATAMALGHPNLRFQYTLFSATIGIGLLIAMTPFGLLWAASALLIRSLIAETMFAARVLRLVSAPPRELIALLKLPTLAVSAIALVAWLNHVAFGRTWEQHDFIVLAITGSAAYSAIILLFDRTSVSAIRSILLNRRSP